MLKLSYRYDQTAARLEVDGLPDFSSGHRDSVIGIMSAWRLQLVGAPELEGKRDHLEALMAVVLPYARHQISGVSRPEGWSHHPVSIRPVDGGHQLGLSSSQPDVPPLEIKLDDADLADLLRCLDALRADDRVAISWPEIINHPLSRRELVERVPLVRRLAAPVLGGVALVVVGVMAMVVPLPSQETKAPTDSVEAASPDPVSDPSQADPSR
ncbi:MAG: DUF4335 domain-containing protein [Synechococcus sp. ChSW.bin.154]